MFGYPNYSFPLYRNYNRYNRYSLNTPFIPTNMRKSVNITNMPHKEKSQTSNNSDKSSFIKDSEKQEDRNLKDKKSSQNEFFEIFGIKLFFDDLIIISLLFFLYSEGVNDYYLFITLILLLLT